MHRLGEANEVERVREKADAEQGEGNDDGNNKFTGHELS
jgi:hypothetical protein